MILDIEVFSLQLKPRDTQTCVKHLILKSYLNQWGGIIGYGLRRHGYKMHLVYVDGFAYCGRYAGDHKDLLLGETDTEMVFGSPIIGVCALDSIKDYFRTKYDSDVQTNAILVEIESETFNTLLENLKIAGFGDRIKFSDYFESLRDGEIAVLNSDCHDVVDKALEYTSGYTFAFYLLDPYGPKGIPFDIVSRIVTQHYTDVMITFPYQDLHKKTGILQSEEVEPVSQTLVDNYTMMFGGEEWIEIYHEAYSSTADNDERKRAIEEALIKHYQERLQSVDEKLVVKNVGLQFPDKERTMFYLFFTTHDPTGALKLNEVLYEGKLKEYALRWEYRHAKEFARTRQMTLFETALVPAPSPETFERQVDIEEVADKVYDLFNGQTVSFRNILQSQANTVYYINEIRKALTKLKREKRAEYDKLTRWDSQIKFRPKGRSK